MNEKKTATPKCKYCLIPMERGQAIPPAVVKDEWNQRTEGAWQNTTPTVEVWKCPKCGHSFTTSEEWRLPDPPAGQSWHRPDGWTAEMLPPPYRPLLKGEKCQDVDEFFLTERTWKTCRILGVEAGKLEFIRTKRPLPTPPQAATGGEEPWAKEKAAHKAGKRIQLSILADGKWTEFETLLQEKTPCFFEGENYRYRIHPDDQPEPEPVAGHPAPDAKAAFATCAKIVEDAHTPTPQPEKPSETSKDEMKWDPAIVFDQKQPSGEAGTAGEAAHGAWHKAEGLMPDSHAWEAAAQAAIAFARRQAGSKLRIRRWMVGDKVGYDAGWELASDGKDLPSHPCKAAIMGFEDCHNAILAYLPPAQKRDLLFPEHYQIREELCAWLDSQAITSENIGDIRRSLFVPWDSLWNGIVRDETAKREKEAQPPQPPQAEGKGEGWPRVEHLADAVYKKSAHLQRVPWVDLKECARIVSDACLAAHRKEVDFLKRSAAEAIDAGEVIIARLTGERDQAEARVKTLKREIKEILNKYDSD